MAKSFIVGIAGVNYDDECVWAVYAENPQIAKALMGKGVGYPSGCKCYTLADPHYFCSSDLSAKMALVTVQGDEMKDGATITSVQEFSGFLPDCQPKEEPVIL